MHKRQARKVDWRAYFSIDGIYVEQYLKYNRGSRRPRFNKSEIHNMSRFGNMNLSKIN